MSDSGSCALIFAGVLTLLVAAAHLACIFVGSSAYRFMGAGERMARAAEAGRVGPTLITLGISVVLVIWAAYAFSAAGLIDALPLTKLALLAISATLLARSFGFPMLKKAFPENSRNFWLVSSGICLALGTLYLWGIAMKWTRL